MTVCIGSCTRFEPIAIVAGAIDVAPAGLTQGKRTLIEPKRARRRTELRAACARKRTPANVPPVREAMKRRAATSLDFEG